MRLKTLFYIIFFILLFSNCSDKWDKSKHLFGQNNGIWSESIYLRGFQPTTRERLTDNKIYTFSNKLSENKIRYVYLFAGPYGSDGHLPSYAFSETAIQTIKKLKSNYPGLIILPWIGGIQNKTVHLEDSVWVNTAISDTKRLISVLGVPGVHVDMEFINQDNPIYNNVNKIIRFAGTNEYGRNLIEFHRKLRLSMPEAFISSVVVATSPDTRPWKRKASVQELKILVEYIDQLSFLYYDTHIVDQEVFDKNCKLLIEDIEFLSNYRDIQYLVSVGTFINEPHLQKFRNLNIESIPNTLNTIKENIIKVNNEKKVVDGISIYCDWETDNREWTDFYQYWSKYQ